MPPCCRMASFYPERQEKSIQSACIGCCFYRGRKSKSVYLEKNLAVQKGKSHRMLLSVGFPLFGKTPASSRHEFIPAQREAAFFDDNAWCSPNIRSTRISGFVFFAGGFRRSITQAVPKVKFPSVTPQTEKRPGKRASRTPRRFRAVRERFRRSISEIRFPCGLRQCLRCTEHTTGRKSSVHTH